MVRIAEGVWPDEVQERNYFTARGEYRIDDEATPTMRDSMMYRMSYHGYVIPLHRISANTLTEDSMKCFHLDRHKIEFVVPV